MKSAHYCRVLKWIHKRLPVYSLQKRIKDHLYRSIDDLETDVMTLCKNAQAYNMEGSLVSFVETFLQLRQREKRQSIWDATFSY